MAKLDFPIILLAAGASSRMQGRDKLLEDVEGRPLLRRRAEIARAATRTEVIVTLPPAPHPRYHLLQDLDVKALPVTGADEGIAASLRTGIAALPGDIDCVMVLLADLPELTKHDLLIVAQSVDLKSKYEVWRGTTEAGEPGHPIVFKASLLPQLAALTGDRGAQAIIAERADRVCHVPLKGRRARRDLDTPEDWERWRAERG